MQTVLRTTKRLVLRKFERADLSALYSILKDEEVNTFLPWFPLQSLEQTEAFYKQHYLPLYEQGRGYAYAVCLKADNVPVGYVHVAPDDSFDLGYGLKKEFWRRGILTEACRAVVCQAKEDGVAYLTATHDVNNPRSGAVMRRIGMRYRYTYQELVQPKNQLVTFRLYQLNLDGREERVYQKYWHASAVHFVEAGL